MFSVAMTLLSQRLREQKAGGNAKVLTSKSENPILRRSLRNVHNVYGLEVDECSRELTGERVFKLVSIYNYFFEVQIPFPPFSNLSCCLNSSPSPLVFPFHTLHTTLAFANLGSKRFILST